MGTGGIHLTYTHLLFDADDTLFDYPKAESRALLGTLEYEGLPGTAEVMEAYQMINQQLWREFEQGTVTLASLRTERFARLFTQLELKTRSEVSLISEYYLDRLGEGHDLIDGAYDICSTLIEAGYRLSIITNGIKKVQTSRIAKSPLNGMFEQIIVSEDTGYQKPHPGIFDHAFNKLGITDKSRVMIIGDSLTSDMQGGINYGIATCWFNPQGKPNTLGLQPTYEIRSLAEITNLVAPR